MYSRGGARSYAQVGLETGVNAATPEKLITMLFDGAHVAIARARHALEQKDVPARGAAIGKAVGIVSDGLKAVLDRERGGEVAANLYALYDYIERCLLTANLRGDRAKLDEADRLLGGIASAWKEMAAANAPASSTAAAPAGPGQTTPTIRVAS
ncbi:flagellar export chaperone FliS [Verticiella sediminum]|uniref:Flagellar secretion chaperone FliS n=1 Tax=Verticiella sediminum TaxID=1247510 RepID=A0A556AS89_9BURK|nr:flagellar export chaperone FliS [Verticiella sediminum]